jgi:hypothetical protein
LGSSFSGSSGGDRSLCRTSAGGQVIGRVFQWRRTVTVHLIGTTSRRRRYQWRRTVTHFSRLVRMFQFPYVPIHCGQQLSDLIHAALHLVICL